MNLKDLLDKKWFVGILNRFKSIFGGVVFILDNAGGMIGEGCQGASGITACIQCPNYEFQLSFPIVVDRITLGSLVFCPTIKDERPTSEVKMENLELIACMIARLTSAERDTVSLAEEVSSNYEILNLIYEIGEIIATTFEREEVCSRILEMAGGIVGAGSGCIMVRKENETCYSLVASYGVKEDLAKGLELRPHLGGIVNKTIFEGKAGLVSKIDTSLPLTRIESLFPPPLLITPMKSSGRIVGWILLARKDGGKEFTSSDLKLIQAIAIQAGAVVRNLSLFGDLKEFFRKTVKALSSAIDSRHHFTIGHSERVARYSLAIAEEMNIAEKDRECLELVAYLHDVGMMSIPEKIINSSERLTEEEFNIIKEHPLLGVEVIRQISEFEKVIPGIWHHHEHYNGSGYPAALSREDIPLNSRIIAVADAFDAMISDRPHRKAFSQKAALVELEECMGTQFDPLVVAAFKRAYENGKIKEEIPEREKEAY